MISLTKRISLKLRIKYNKLAIRRYPQYSVLDIGFVTIIVLE